MIGLTCDGLMDTSMFNLYKGCDVYFTDDSYYASYPFPNEWIEMFKGNRANEMMEEDANMDLNEILKYKPIMSQREIFNPKGCESVPGSEIKKKKHLKLFKPKSATCHSIDAWKKMPLINKDPYLTDTMNTPRLDPSKKKKVKKQFVMEFNKYTKFGKASSSTSTKIYKKMYNNEKNIGKVRNELDESKESSTNTGNMTETILVYLSNHKVLTKRNGIKRNCNI